MGRVSVLSFVLLAACVDHGAEGMFIVDNSASPVGSTCMFTSETTQPFTTHGAIYAGSPSPYEMTPLIESRLTAVAGQEATHTITLQGADVILSEASTTGELNVIASYTSLFAATVPPNAGLTNASFDLISVDTLQTIFANGTGKDTELSANITIYGQEGGGRIDGVPFDYPVTACMSTAGGCTVVDNGDCPLTVAVARLGDPCNVFQDGIVDCCRDPTTQVLECPGPTM